MVKVIENNKNSEDKIIIYRSKDGTFKVDVKLSRETAWLSLNQIAMLFSRGKSVISRHINNIFNSKELRKNSVVAKIATTASDEKVYNVEYYSLDMIISVGYRVNSKRATSFRIWVTRVLRNHILKGYTINQKRLQEKGFKDFEQAIKLTRETMKSKRLDSREARGFSFINC